MIINRRTSFTNLEYPNPFEDPAWTTFDVAPNKTLVASTTPGTATVGTGSYRVPDGASGWYVFRVVPDGVDASNRYVGSWGYTYLHEGSVAYFWCNAGSTGIGRKDLGANGSNGAVGGAAGIVCGFKQSDGTGANNYGVYSTAKPHMVASGNKTFTRWQITFADGRTIYRYTLGTEQWDATVSATAATYINIDGKPCFSFEDPAETFGATGASVVRVGTEVFDGIYIGTVPTFGFDNHTAFSIVSGLIVGQSGNANGAGAGALGSSVTLAGPTLEFGAATNDNSNGGIAFFDFSRSVFLSNQNREFFNTTTPGVYLYKTVEDGHDYTEPYAQIFTADEALSDATFEFYVNEVRYEFPSDWPDADKQIAFTGEYKTYIQNVHIGDILRVVATYANGRSAGGIYRITMHSIVYGLRLDRMEFLWTSGGDYQLWLVPGTYTVKLHGAGGGGGANSGRAGGAGAPGKIALERFVLTEDTLVNIHVGNAGLARDNGGNGGARGVSGGWGGSYMSGGGGGGGEPSYITYTDQNNTEQALYALGGGGGGGGGATTPGGRYASGGAGGGGGGYYRFDTTTNTIVSVPGKDGAYGAAGRSYANGAAGINGNTTDFAGLRSGAGGTGWRTYGGAAASGGGASGGGGGEGGNDSSGFGGAGGGGAGGDDVAGGGVGATNHYTTPLATENYLGVEVTSGWGTGGSPGMNGYDGWIYLAMD